MEIITILSVIAIIYLFIQNYKIKKNVKGLKTLVKVLYKENYKNDNEIRSLYNLIALKHKEIKDYIEEISENYTEKYKEKYENYDEIKRPVFPERSDMQPSPSTEEIDLYNWIDLKHKEIMKNLDKKK